MAFQYTIKKCKISVDRKKYTKNEINIGYNLMFIYYGKPGKFNGKVIISMKNPQENVSEVLLKSRFKVLEFTWTGLWENEEGKESKKTLQFKIEFERGIDAERTHSALKKKLPLKKGRHTKRKIHKGGKKQKQTKKKGSKGIKGRKGRKGPEESATLFSVGTEKQGNDGNTWVIQIKRGKGIQRWVKKEDIKAKTARGKNKELEKLWTDMSNMNKLVFIMKIKQLDGSYYKIHKIKRTEYQDKIDEGNNDPNVKAILTAGNSFDGYQQLYDKVKQKSVRDILKQYKKYWKYNLDDKLFTC